MHHSVAQNNIKVTLQVSQWTSLGVCEGILYIKGSCKLALYCICIVYGCPILGRQSTLLLTPSALLSVNLYQFLYSSVHLKQIPKISRKIVRTLRKCFRDTSKYTGGAQGQESYTSTGYRVTSYTWPYVSGTLLKVISSVFACTVAFIGQVTLYK